MNFTNKSVELTTFTTPPELATDMRIAIGLTALAIIMFLLAFVWIVVRDYSAEEKKRYHGYGIIGTVFIGVISVLMIPMTGSPIAQQHDLLLVSEASVINDIAREKLYEYDVNLDESCMDTRYSSSVICGGDDPDQFVATPDDRWRLILVTSPDKITTSEVPVNLDIRGRSELVE